MSKSVESNGVATALPGDLAEPIKTHMNEYAANLKCHRKGISHHEMVMNYNSWAQTYDEDLRSGVYNGPEIISRIAADNYSPEERTTLKIIDVAAGTGKVGKELHKLGFRCVDALEPSEKMLSVAKETGVYKKLIQEAIGTEPTSIDDHAYDCLVMSGGMGEGHIPTKALDELARIVKPGGAVFIVMREEYLSNVSDYNGKLEPYMAEMAQKKLWRQRTRKVVSNYSFNKNGVVFIFDVL